MIPDEKIIGKFQTSLPFSRLQYLDALESIGNYSQNPKTAINFDIFGASKFRATLVTLCNGFAVIFLCTSETTSTENNSRQSHVYPVSALFFLENHT